MGSKWSEESKAGIRGEGNPFYGHKHTTKNRKKFSKILIGNKRSLGFVHSEETRAKLRASAPKTKSEEHKENISKALREYLSTPKGKASRMGKNNGFYGKHHTEESLRKMMLSNNTRPNRQELKLKDILEKILPDEYAMNVTGWTITLGGKIPDFVNVNGQKKIIELYGDHWHKGENPKKRKRYFKKFGYDTLVIWQSELKNLHKTQQRILRFNKEK